MTNTMALAPSKLTAPLTTQTGKTAAWKRKASFRIMDENFEGAERNAVTKCLKLAANTTWAASVKCQQRQPSVKDVEDEDSTSSNSSPKNPNALLEAASESDDVNILILEDFKEDDDGEDGPIKTAEAQCSESIKM
jgi:hypothetical protein